MEAIALVGLLHLLADCLFKPIELLIQARGKEVLEAARAKKSVPIIEEPERSHVRPVSEIVRTINIVDLTPFAGDLDRRRGADMMDDSLGLVGIAQGLDKEPCD